MKALTSCGQPGFRKAIALLARIHFSTARRQVRIISSLIYVLTWAIHAQPTPGTLLWEFQITPKSDGSYYAHYSSPAVSREGFVYIGSPSVEGTNVYALKVSNGDLLWGFRTDSGIDSSPSIGPNGTIYIGSGSGIFALDGRSGAKIWHSNIYQRVWSSPALGINGLVYVGSDDANVYALESNDGSLVWKFSTGGRVQSSPAIGFDGTVYVGSEDGKVYALAGDNGSLLWQFQAGGEVDCSLAIGSAGTVYFTSLDGKVYALNPATGDKIWEFQTTGWQNWSRRPSPVVASDGSILVSSTGGTIYVLDGASGTLMRQFTITDSGYYISLALTANGTLYALSEGGMLYAVDAATGAVKWQYVHSGYGFIDLTLGFDGTLYFSEGDGKVRALAGEGLLADSAWPMSGRNPEHTRCAQVPGPPRIVVEPASQAIPAGAKAVLTVVVTGTSPFTYAWRKDSIPIADGGRISGAHSAQLTIFDMMSSDLGSYSVVITSSEGATTSAAAELTFRKPLDAEIRWVTSLGKDIAASPCIGPDGVVYVGTWDGSVVALDGATGARRWLVPSATGWPVHSSPAVSPNGLVFWGSRDHKVHAFTTHNADNIWEFETGGDVDSSPALAPDGTLYIGAGDGRLYAFESETGDKLWEFDTKSWIFSSPAVADDGSIYIASKDGSVHAVNGRNGDKLWTFLAGADITASPAIGMGGIVYIGSWDGKVYALEGTTGRKLWDYQTGGVVFSSAAVGPDGTIYVGSRDHRIYALNGESGFKRWDFETGGDVDSTPALAADGVLYVGSWDGTFYAVNAESGIKRWGSKTGGPIWSSPAIATDGTVYVGSNDGNLYAFFGGSPPSGSPWPMFQQNARHSAFGRYGPPLIVQQPQSQTNTAGSTVRFSVIAVGSEPLSYQWRFNGIALAEAALPVLVLTNIQPAHAGSYDVVITNLIAPAITSRQATLAVETAAPPIISSISIYEGEVILTWKGDALLFSANDVNGPWLEVLNARSPYRFEPVAERQFFRLRWP